MLSTHYFLIRLADGTTETICISGIDFWHCMAQAKARGQLIKVVKSYWSNRNEVS
jgi:hypothetical protein